MLTMPQHEFPEENHTRSVELSCFKVTLQISKKVMIEKCFVIFVKQGDEMALCMILNKKNSMLVRF